MKKILLSLIMIAQSSFAGVIATSGSDQNQMLELYSSESCSSCPPADKWVSALKAHPMLWKSVFPIVFHVDYWNGLGWKDELSDSKMTQRQIDLSHQWAKSQVYTPGFIVNGKEWSNWSGHPLPELPKKTTYQIALNETEPLKFQVGVNKGSLSGKNLIVRMALLGFGLESNVTSGENSGKHLAHDFVVLDWDWKNVTSSYRILFNFKKPPQKVERLAAVVWLEETENPTPLQVTGGYLK